MAYQSLRPTDVEQFARLGISPELLDAAGVQRVTDAQARDRLRVAHRGDLTGILFPRVDPITGREVGYRVRRDHPEMEDGRPKNKHLSSIDRSHWFFPPSCAGLLTDTTVPVVIVEAEKSSLALTAVARRNGLALLPIALGGVWNWKGRIGKTTDASGARVDEHGPLPDFGLIEWSGRKVTLLFDANVGTNSYVKAARRGLANELAGRGARVFLGTLPEELGVNGPDDYLAAHGDQALVGVIDGADPAARPQDLPITELLAAHGLAEPVDDIPIEELDSRLRSLSDALIGADNLRRALVSAELKTTAKIAAGIVNAALGVERRSSTSPERLSFLADDEPWPDPVNGAALLDDTTAAIRRHVILGESQAHAAALWTGAAHAIDALDLIAMLLFTSPTPECGKSTAATVMSALTPRALRVASLTPAVLFRLVHNHHPTLIADEADAWLNDEKSELRGVFNCAHDRHGARIPRCVGDHHDVEVFDVFGPKIIAMIGKPPVTMRSRSIEIGLRRKAAAERAEHVRVERLREALAPLRRRWQRWAQDNLEALRAHEPAMPAALPINRTADNWRPLIALADLAGGEWPARARRAALELAGLTSLGQTRAVELLQDVRTVFQEDDEAGTLSSEEIITALKAMTERPWADWNKGRGLTAMNLASSSATSEKAPKAYGPVRHARVPRPASGGTGPTSVTPGLGISLPTRNTRNTRNNPMNLGLGPKCWTRNTRMVLRPHRWQFDQRPRGLLRVLRVLRLQIVTLTRDRLRGGTHG